MQRYVPLLLVLLLYNLLLPVDASADEIVIGKQFDELELTHEIRYWVDSGGDATLNEALGQSDWEPVTDTLNFGFSDAAYWLRFVLNNPQDHSQHLLLEIDYPFLDDIQIVLLENDKIISRQQLGDSHPATSRLIRHPHFLAPLSLAPGQKVEAIIRVQTTSTLQIPIKLWEKNHFIEQDQFKTTLHTLFYGLLLAISLYHIMLFLSVKEKSFLYYGLFIVFLMGTFISLKGIPTVFLWPDNTYLTDYLVLMSLAGGIVFSCLFSIEILLLRESHPRLARLLYGIATAALLLACAIPVISYAVLLKLLLLSSIINIIVNLLIHIVRFIDGYPPARFVIVAAIPTCIGIGTTVLAKTAVLPSNTLTELAAYIGCSMMALLYAQAISYRMNMDRDLREDAQRQLTEQLDMKVRERTEELEKAYAALQQVSITDGLTKTFNRRHFDETIDKEYRRALRDKFQLSVLLLDIDHFKSVNDNYGHPFGDLCLQVVAQRIQDCVRRPPDFVARYGGEEFVVLLPNTDSEGALKTAERIRKAIAADPVKNNNTTLALTASIGVATTVPDQPQQQDRLIKQADEYLYQAKANGRNQVVGGNC